MIALIDHDNSAPRVPRSSILIVSLQRMKNSRREFLKTLGIFGGAFLLYGRKSPVLAFDGDFEVLVVGDSLIAGQGLYEEDRFSVLTRQWLEQELSRKNRAVHYKDLSHSGARLFLQQDEIDALEKAGKARTTFYHREVNFSFPSIKAQIDIAKSQYIEEGKSPSDIELILVSGGITDLTTAFVFNAFKKYRPLRAKIEEHCNEGMFRWLRHASETFPNALIAVIGYFPPVSKKSSTGRIFNSVLELYEFPGPTKPIVNNIVTKQFLKILHARLNKRTRIWYEGSTSALKTAVRRINEFSGKKTAVFVESPIPKDRSFETKDSLLFGMGKKGRSKDFMYDLRLEECANAIAEFENADLDLNKRFCELAGLGHPNPEGSRLYAKAIQEVLQAELTGL